VPTNESSRGQRRQAAPIRGSAEPESIPKELPAISQGVVGVVLLARKFEGLAREHIESRLFVTKDVEHACPREVHSA
jgi:hypothetical protein